ncbi:MAG TPA: DegV family protein [Anaerolineaceae bacterium]|nr:DegV family protein [Anaerolineaceae bacterium]
MKIVCDSGADLTLEEYKELDITVFPLKVEVDGVSYQAGVDISPTEFYDLMDNAENMPKTATPSLGDIVDVYKRLAQEDRDIISVHISSGLSGTSNVARQAALLVPEANITVVDTLTLSAGQAWQVRAAALMAKANKSREEILEKLSQIQQALTSHFTLPDLKYLIAGGRIGHLKGLLASLLGIKPIIEVNKEDGKYYDVGKRRSFQKAIDNIPELLLKYHQAGAQLRAQIVTAANSEGGEKLKQAMEKVFNVSWEPEVVLGTALGAHTGRGLVGVIAAMESALPVIP